MELGKTALLLIGFQNDYYSDQGILHEALEESDRIAESCRRSLCLINDFIHTPATIVATPINFTPDYSELIDPIGILKIIKDNGAFKAGSLGAQTIAEIAAYGDRILSLPGKRGLNCFSNTDVNKVLQQNNVEDVLILGAVTSLCIDTAGREAADLGYRVHIVKDCMVARTKFEHDYYSNEIMPLYANVISSEEIRQQYGLDKSLEQTA